MEIGAVLTVNIESLGGKGDGALEMEGRKLLVPFALPGERVKIRVTEITPGYISGEIIEYITTSQARAKPPCRHFYKCGGCRLQHMDDGLYNDFKRSIFLKALDRAGAVLPSPELIVLKGRNRRRAIFKTAFENGQVKLGFYETNSHNVVDMEECHILEPEIFSFSQKLKECIKKLQAPGKVPEVLVTLADSGLDVLLYAGYEPSLQDVEALKNLAQMGNATRISWKFAGRIIPIISTRAMTMRFGKIDVILPEEPFLQPTKSGQELITKEVMRALSSGKNILDLFSGCGTYSFALAEKSRVHGVEMSEEMVQAMKKAAAKLGAPVTAERRNLNNNPLTTFELAPYAGAVINPPRAGAAAQCKMLAKSMVKKIVMVSCNPDTFSRDAKALLGGGYKITGALAIDQFYWSNHLEIVAVFEK